MRAKDPKVHYRRRVIQAAIGFILGVGAVAAGLYLKYNWLAAIGFAIMIVSSIWAVASYRRMAGMLMDRSRRRDRRDRRAPKTAPTSGLMERIEERWRRRQEGNSR